VLEQEVKRLAAMLDTVLSGKNIPTTPLPALMHVNGYWGAGAGA
jgi:hypothetical protein